jgi:hypothetical protein
VRELFFRFRGGLPFHKVHFLIFRNPLEVPTTLLPRCDWCPELHLSMPFVVVQLPSCARILIPVCLQTAV